MALDIGADYPGYSALRLSFHGGSSLASRLIQYSWTNWDDPVDVCFVYNNSPEFTNLY
jgi:hypothetical protein